MLRLRLILAASSAFFVLTTPTQAAWVWPVSGDVITAYRNGSDPYATGQHRGIDIAAPVGAPVRAAATGDVRFAGTAGYSGLTISIRTADGYDTSYLHLSGLDVRAGARVSAGDRIGAVGTTGTRSAAAPHLHFGVRDAGTRHAYRDPLAFLPPAPPASPTPEPPSPAPAAHPEPAPPSPIPAPVPHAAPGSGRAPMPAPRPHAAPGSRRAPIPRAGPAPGRSPAPRAAPRPSRHRLPIPASSPRPSPIPRGGLRDQASPEREASATASGASEAISSEPGPRSLRPGAVPLESPAGRRRADAHRGGPDIGLVLACAGLLLAAGVLGLTEDGRRATSRTGSRVLGALPGPRAPLTQRRRRRFLRAPGARG